jgi:hypothetical protein
MGLYYLEKSVVAEHGIKWGHRIQFHDTSILAKKYGLTECIIREEIGIELHPDNMSRLEYFSPSRSRKPLNQTLKELNKVILRTNDILPLYYTFHYTGPFQDLSYSILFRLIPSYLPCSYGSYFDLPSGPVLMLLSLTAP